MSDPNLSSLLDKLQSNNYDKFTPNFEIIESTYPSANGTDNIKVHILVPKCLSPGARHQPRPLMVRIHGGYLVSYLLIPSLSMLGKADLLGKPYASA